MSPEAGNILVAEIMPRIQKYMKRNICRMYGSEDTEELTADCLAWAAKTVTADEKAGRTIKPKSIAYVAVLRARYGLRSTGVRQRDVLDPMAQKLNRAKLVSLDQPLMTNNENNVRYWREVLADVSDDPAEKAGRNLDWSDALKKLKAIQRDILTSELDGRSRQDLATKYDLTLSMIHHYVRRSRKILAEHWQPEDINTFRQQSLWRKHVRTYRERCNWRTFRKDVARSSGPRKEPVLAVA